jgi:hypothetical protein
MLCGRPMQLCFLSLLFFLICRVGLIFGIMMWPNLWLLFLPIPQSSFLQQLSGLNYSQMIRYHRCGCGLVWMLWVGGWVGGVCVGGGVPPLLDCGSSACLPAYAALHPPSLHAALAQVVWAHHHGGALRARLVLLPLLGHHAGVSRCC